MKHVFFTPWVGKEYAAGGIFGKRILVLGESHYGDGEPPPNTTVQVFDEYLGCPETVPSYLQSFHKFERSLVGRNTDCTDRKRIWNSVVFYNYLQTPMSGPRQGGKKSDYANSSEAFFEVLEEYRPEYIIVWGYRLWDNMPTERWKWGEEIVVDGLPAVKFGYYTLSDGTRIKAIPIKHPSAGYSWAKWHELIDIFTNNRL